MSALQLESDWPYCLSPVQFKTGPCRGFVRIRQAVHVGQTQEQVRQMYSYSAFNAPESDGLQAGNKIHEVPSPSVTFNGYAKNPYMRLGLCLMLQTV